MRFICMEDFYRAAAEAPSLTAEQELALETRAQMGEEEARKLLLGAYLADIAQRIKRRLPAHRQTLRAVYHYLHAIESAISACDLSKGSLRSRLPGIFQGAELSLLAEE